MSNILNVIFSPVIREKFKFPTIKKITFLQTADTKEIIIDKKSYSVADGCDLLLERIGGEDIEIRRKTVKTPAIDIPQIILSAVKEVGKENLILDLTVGKKDITGFLYTAACISELRNTIYVDVLRNPQTSNFYNLEIDDKTIDQKIKITQFQAIQEIENLASLNCMDFILYKKSIDEFVPKCDENNFSRFHHAIDSYFAKEHKNCIRDIGEINENLIFRFSKFFKANFSEYYKENKYKFFSIRDLQSSYEQFLDPKKQALGEAQFKALHSFFGHFPALFEMLSLVKNYRNLASHDNSFAHELKRDDAKLVIDTELRLFRSLSEIEFFAKEIKDE